MLQHLVNGLLLGALFTLVAVGFSVNVGVLGVLNIALIQIFMIGAFVGWALLDIGLNVPLALLGSLLAGLVCGAIVELIGFRPVNKTDPAIGLLSTTAVGVILYNLAVGIWGTEPTFFPLEAMGERLTVGPVAVNVVQLVSLGVGIVAVALLWVVLAKTFVGRGLRAVAEDRDAAVLLGLRVRSIEVLAFLASGILCGGAGFLLALNYGVISPEFGFAFAITGLAAMVVGGVANVWGGLIGGPLLGVAFVLSTAYLGSEYRAIVVFGILIGILLIRPHGLLGGRESIARV